jgi:hypothetical protein
MPSRSRARCWRGGQGGEHGEGVALAEADLIAGQRREVGEERAVSSPIHASATGSRGNLCRQAQS